MTPLKITEYIRIHVRDIPDEIITEQKLKEKTDAKGVVYIVASRGMYGLPQSGTQATELLEKKLNKNCYKQIKFVPGLWKHECRPVKFMVVVDNFGVKYVWGKHAFHFKQTLEEHYKFKTEWYGTRYIVITLDWDYRHRQVHL